MERSDNHVGVRLPAPDLCMRRRKIPRRERSAVSEQSRRRSPEKIPSPCSADLIEPSSARVISAYLCKLMRSSKQNAERRRTHTGASADDIHMQECFSKSWRLAIYPAFGCGLLEPHNRIFLIAAIAILNPFCRSMFKNYKIG